MIVDYIKKLVGAHKPRPMTMAESFQEGKCPDCGHNEFLFGPSGGLCQNVTCDKCGSRFNVSIVGGNCFHAERI